MAIWCLHRFLTTFFNDQISREVQVRIIARVMRLPKKKLILRKQFKTRPQIQLSRKLILEKRSIL